MAKIIYLEKELDNSKEHELFAKNDFGFTVVVKYKSDSWMSKHEEGQVVDTFNNITEVHYMFESMDDTRTKCAFESDILQTGGTRNIADIESITIALATKMVEEWQETDVITTIAFKDELEKEFIPAIERMVKKQEEHIDFLKARARKIKYFQWLNSEPVGIDEIIEDAEKMVCHLKGRLAEYREYAEKLEATTNK